MSRLSHSFGLAVAISALSLGSVRLAFAAPQEPPAETASSMKPYVETIAGTDLTFEMLPIPGGTFVMGSPPPAEKKDDEPLIQVSPGPQHPVQIAPFWMGKCEVTWEEYDEFAFSLDVKKKARDKVDLSKQPETEKNSDAVTRPTPPYADMTFGFGRNGQPALCMTHHAAMEYCRWLSAKTGKIYRLPTEAEWEYACRAGTKTRYSWGDDPAPLEEYAWCVNNSEKPMKVGKKKPNPWGLYDMHGNVSEWCLDHYLPDAYKAYPTDKPTLGPVILPDAKEYSYVARGGSWDDDPDKLGSAVRRGSEREWSVQDPQRPQSIWWHTNATFVGFRVVRPLSEQANLKGLKSQVVKGKGTR